MPSGMGLSNLFLVTPRDIFSSDQRHMNDNDLHKWSWFEAPVPLSIVAYLLYQYDILNPVETGHPVLYLQYNTQDFRLKDCFVAGQFLHSLNQIPVS